MQSMSLSAYRQADTCPVRMESDMFDQSRIRAIVQAYKDTPESVYNTWFVNNEARLKAFGAIRRGVDQVVKDIRAGTFPNDFKGSSLETVLTAITEQKQVFTGAAHPFYWKPKLRIPDIYENDANKAAFGQFLEACARLSKEDQIIKEIIRLSNRNIKGVGPAITNILYFIHPTLVPPFNTAMLNGFNLIFQEKKRLGSWDDYLSMRDTIISVNDTFKNLLSKDLGAIAGLLFDVGVGTLVVDENAQEVLEDEEKRRAKQRKKRREEIQVDLEEESMHTRIQYLLVKIGRALGYDVAVASNDRTKSWEGETFSFMTLPELPTLKMPDEVRKTVSLIDVIWIERQTNKIVCAYEVEKSTSIYSGVLRLFDLALTLRDIQDVRLYLVAPEQREREVVAQLKRPSLVIKAGTQISYILFSELCEHCNSICKFGEDHTVMQKIAKNAFRAL